MKTKLSVVIPAYNEEHGVEPVLRELRSLLEQHDIEPEIILVDDGSSDGTAAAARRAGARVLRHRYNRGYGAALKTGIAAATHELIAMTDADGTYPARFLPTMLAELKHADMVVGARTGENVNIPLVRKPAKWALNMLANYVTGVRIPDLNSGLRVFRRDMIMQYFPILPDQFSWTTTITLAMLCDRYAIEYVPIDYHRRTGRSKIVPWDAMNFAILILRTAMLFRPLRVFLPLVMLFFGYAAIKMIYDVVHNPSGGISDTVVLASVSGLLTLLVGALGDAIATRLGHVNPNVVVGVRPKDVIEEEV